MEAITKKSIGLDGTVFDERRADLRHRVFKGATLTFNRGYGALEGLVRNLSNGGALLKFGDASAVPSRFDLTIAGESEARKARVCWRRQTEVGVAFEDRPGE
ncbi:PilZ domain-containing protein [Mesorhizobium sp. CAU 1741]|uniref:PilZ domain-containing protein n=1 Tax=Mesorhizobium sp. CAU 1741 TaxID=3140366 RepID=UPI00325B0073